MEDTQVLNWEVEEEEEVEESPTESVGYSLEPLGQLHIFSSSYGPEKDFPLYLGKNMIGRMPDCSVALPFSSISKQHAVIEISAWDKAPVLRDCGSLNGTQILRPPKVLGPGVSHRLQDRELILFADLPCQYHRLDVPRPFVSRGPLTVEETPRVPGGTQTSRLLLAEDSEEEADSLLHKCVVKGPRTSLATVVPESDEEGPSPTPDGPGPPAFDLNSDTDEEESQQSGAGEASSAARRGTAAETEQLEPVTAEVQIEKDQCSVKERNRDTEIKRDVRTGVVPIGVILERSQPSGEGSDTDVSDESGPPRRLAGVRPKRAWSCNFIDSDTDGEDEGIPATPAVVPMKERQTFHEAGTQSPQACGVVHRQESPADGDTDIEEGEAPPDRIQASMVIDSNTDGEEEVSAALTLARLRESQAGKWNRDPDAEEDRAQPVALLERSQACAGGDSDTDVEEEGLPVERRGMVPKGHMDREYSKKSQHPPRDSDTEGKEDESSPGVYLERSQASAQVEDEVSLGPAVALPEKRQVRSIVWTHHTDAKADGGPAQLPVLQSLEEAQPPLAGDCEPDAENTSSAVSGVRKSQLLVEKDAGTTWAAAVPEQDRALATGTQGGSSTAPGEQDFLLVSRENLADLVVDTGTPGEPQPQREGAQPTTGREREAHGNRATDSGENLHDSEDLDLPATQCFVDRENQSLEAVPSMEDEPTQAFLFPLPQEPGPSCCSFQATGSLDEAWEVLATQPFCPRESEASETQTAVTLLDTPASYPHPSRTAQQKQHPESPVHAEPLGMEGRGMQTLEKDMGTPRETAERVIPEGGPLQKETKKLPSEREREDATGEEELIGAIQDREQNQVLARDTQSQESDKKVKSASTGRGMETVKVEIETPKETQEREREKQTLAGEIFESEAGKLVAERESEAGGLEVKGPQELLDRGPQMGETEVGGQDQKGQASGPPPEPGAGAGDLQGLASDLVASGSQAGRGRGAPGSPRRQQRGDLNCEMPPAEKASRGDQESPEACLPPAAPEASASLPNSLISQIQKHPTPQSLLFPSPAPLELPIPRTRQNESQEAPETSFSSELNSVHPEPKVRPQGSSPVSSLPLEPHPTTPTGQPIALEPTSGVSQSRSHSSFDVTASSVIPTALALQPSTSTDQPVTPKPTLRAPRGRAHRSSVKTPEPSVPTDQPVAPELTAKATRGRAQRSSVKTPKPDNPTTPQPQPSTSTDQPVTPKPTSRAPRGRTPRSSAKTPEPVVPTASELQPAAPKDQPVAPELTSRATRGRTQRSSVKTSKPDTSTTPEPQPSTSTDQPVTPKPTSRAPRGRTPKSSAKTPEPVVSTASELQPSALTDQPVTPELPSRATQGRTQRSSVKTPDPVTTTTPELQPSTSTDQLVTPKPTSRAPRGRTRKSSAKTPEPVVPTASELQPSAPADQPVGPLATQCRRHRSSVKTPEPVVPTVPEPHSSTCKDQSVAPEPTPQATQSQTHRSSVKTSQPTEPTAPDLKPSSPTDEPVTPKVIAQGGPSRTRRSSTASAVLVPTTPEFQSPVPSEQPLPPDPIPEVNCSRRPRATRKQGSPIAHVHEPCTTPPEPNSRSSRNQRRGAVKAAKPLSTIPEPAFAQLPEAPPHTPQMPEEEAADGSGFTPEPQPKASQNRKRPSATAHSPPLQKRLQRGKVPEKAASLKGEEENPAARPWKEEGVVSPGPGKRKREQTEEESQGRPSRSLRRTKPIQESTAPKVLFTGVVDARGERTVLALGGSLASSVAEASHLVTDRIRRTVKFLCALGRGIPILSLAWLHESRKAGCFLPPDEYLVTDPEQEKNFGFSLREALSRAQKRRLLEGYEIHVTPGVQPPPPQMGEIINCCGGAILPSMPRSYKPQRVVITCSQDFPRCAIPHRVGLPILSPEFLLTGVLKQEVKPEAFAFSTVEMSST
nr:mediator of DNA damage checkpoint protein 1 isoform X1 [Odocoileus virginianus texanus]XP_020744490.1 mediator of DNA damage checkpoint protein 1 isoform X1 [Odocoileus virginianus texanus]XP_020744491.1 mediator of DNA damage checkpoint protein 1 isoform X1 [Odocoileus virginianus texanus]XP_020744492.1 mediator of DNA damage checkpoint protein 1 isoform X1 [Odocoileus virginianus texanus]XP_020744493.1 mediator of DNA damage checkpoint protein 1 isoform X1 [Odocoileus virginianus texanus]